MKRLSFLLVPLLSLSMALAACGATEEGSLGQEGTELSGVPTTEVEEPGVTAPLTDQATEPGLTEAPTEEVTEPAEGEVPTEETSGDEVIPSTGAVQVNLVSNLMDFEIWNTQAEQVGDVHALVIDVNASQVEYVIIGRGGFLGIGKTLIPVPYDVLRLWTAAEVGAEQSGAETGLLPPNIFVLDVTENELEQAPVIDSLDVIRAQAEAALEGQEQAPESRPFQEREQDIRSYWGSRAGAASGETAEQQPDGPQAGDQMAEAGGQQLVLVRDLRGAPIRGELTGQESAPGQEAPDRESQSIEGQGQITGDVQTASAQGQDLGQVQEITIDHNSGQVRYILVYPNVGFLAAKQGQPPSDLGQTGDPLVGSPDITVTSEYLLAVPFSALRWNAEEQVLIYTGTRSLLEAPTISLEKFETGEWQSEADTFWGQDSGDDANNQPDS